jgi:hypothetical protein
VTEPTRVVARLGRSLVTLLGTAGLALLAGCAFNNDPDLTSARNFERFPVYWAGQTFEGRELTRVQAEEWSVAVMLMYGTCTPDGGFEPSCNPPIQIQIFPLCYHLDAVALPPRARRVTIRGAPVGAQDGAPVLLTRETQIKVYRGEGTDPGIGLRVLRSLRSLNSVSPVITPRGPIPPPRPVVLATRGARCG